MKHKRKKILIAAAVLCLAVVIGFIVHRLLKPEKEPYRIVLIPKIVDETNDFWTSLISGAEMAAQEFGVELEVRAGTSEEDFEGQNQILQEVILEKPDAILMAPCSFTESTELLKEVRKQKIRLGLVDSIVNESVEDLIVATDNVYAGKCLGEYVAGQIGDIEPCIAVIGHVKGSSTAQQREAGIRDGLGEYEPYIKEVVYCGSVYDKAYELAGELMDKYPDLNVLIGLNEYSAVGMARAVRDAGKEDVIFVVGFDSSIEEIQLMEEGIFQGIVIQKPFNIGYLSVSQMVKFLENQNIKHNVDSGYELITMENLYTEENQKLLFPFVE
ncbi:MAG: substrate-binding domain-containing protein [Lachnospiraceae bacterium]|nr:substrate-binding domain-containing protein [Lachnospiraceae bacterium]